MRMLWYVVTGDCPERDILLEATQDKDCGFKYVNDRVFGHMYTKENFARRILELLGKGIGLGMTGGRQADTANILTTHVSTAFIRPNVGLVSVVGLSETDRINFPAAYEIAPFTTIPRAIDQFLNKKKRSRKKFEYVTAR